MLHFLLLGACLFSVYGWLNPAAMRSDTRIVVDQGTIDSLAQRFERVWHRDPTERELQALIQDFVVEEIYYREAKAMGIDQDDPVIRRRLRQKMEMYTDNLATSITPSEELLNEYLQRHPDKFKTESRYSFQQVYLRADRPGAELKSKIEAINSHLKAGEAVTGDRTLLAERYERVDAHTIDRTFGRRFSTKLDDLPLNHWSQPVQSGLGVHFILLSARQPGRVPDLASIRDAVEREWRFDRAQEIDRTLHEKLLARYDVVINGHAK